VTFCSQLDNTTWLKSSKTKNEKTYRVVNIFKIKEKLLISQKRLKLGIGNVYMDLF